MLKFACICNFEDFLLLCCVGPFCLVCTMNKNHNPTCVYSETSPCLLDSDPPSKGVKCLRVRLFNDAFCSAVFCRHSQGATLIPLPEPATLSDAPLNKSSLLQSHLNDCSPCWHCDVAVVSKEKPWEAEVYWHLMQTLPSFVLSHWSLINGIKPPILFGSSISSRVAKSSVTHNATPYPPPLPPPKSDARVALIFSFYLKLEWCHHLDAT